jgi:hypothetical protein
MKDMQNQPVYARHDLQRLFTRNYFHTSQTFLLSRSLPGIMPFHASSNSPEGAPGSERRSRRSFVSVATLLRGSRCRSSSHSSSMLFLGCTLEPGSMRFWRLRASPRMQLSYRFSPMFVEVASVSHPISLCSAVKSSFSWSTVASARRRLRSALDSWAQVTRNSRQRRRWGIGPR